MLGIDKPEFWETLKLELYLELEDQHRTVVMSFCITERKLHMLDSIIM